MDKINEAAYRTALRFIGYRPRSVKEVRNKLTLRGYTQPVVEETIKILAAESLLDDMVFAGMWASERASSKNLGPLKIKNELREKGIEDFIIIEVLGKLSEEENPVDRAVKMLSKKFRDLKKDDRAMISCLVRGGYNFSQARDAVKIIRNRP